MKPFCDRFPLPRSARLYGFLDRYRRRRTVDFVVDGRWGGTFRGNTRDLIERHLYLFGEWEPDLTTWLREQLGPGDALIDVGANIGYFSCVASQLAGSVVAIEASPSIFESLQTNLRLSGATNVRPIHAAASDVEGKLTMYAGPPHNRGRTTSIGRGLPVEADVDALPLLRLLTASEVEAARVVKIDVEGAEWEVTQGLLPVLDSGRDDLEVIIEVWPRALRRADHSIFKLDDLFRERGFNSYLVSNGGYDSYSGKPRRRPMRWAVNEEHGLVDLVYSRRDEQEL